MKTARSLLLGTVLVTAVVLSGCGQGKGPRGGTATEIPEVASLAGFRCGYDTVGQAQMKYGRGLDSTEEYPHGEKIWVSRETDWYLVMDGQVRRDVKGLPDWAEPYIIDSMQVMPVGSGILWPSAPATSIPVKEMSLFGTIHLGMAESEVLALLQARHISPRQSATTSGGPVTLSWSEPGFVRASANVTFREWRVDLDFDAPQGSLVRISIDAR